MPAVWFCLDCEGVAYGWAQGPCIYCGSSQVISTHPNEHPPSESMSNYRLILIRDREWAQLEAEAIISGRSSRELLAEREQMEVVLIRDEPVEHGQLVLFKTSPKNTKVNQQE